jgi:hypothetical protein
MVILTSYAANTYKAQIRSSLAGGFKQLYTASCTMSEEHAAKAVVEKNFGAIAAAKVQQVKDGAEIDRLVGDFFRDPQRKQVFSVWTFEMRARTPQPAPASDEPPAPEWIGKPKASSKAGTASVITAPAPADILQAARKDLEKHSAAIKHHIESFDKLTLANKLGLGLAALKAHMVFAVVDPAKRGQGRKGENQLTRELISGGFKGWLDSIGADLKEPVAYKYMTAVRGLGLDHTAADRQIAAELKRRERAGEAVTLAGLIAAATERLAPPAEPPAPAHQLTFDDYVATLKQLREDAEQAIEQSKDMPEPLRKQLVARFYASLHALTGTHWQPSDDPHELGTIDPDTITL